MTGTTVASFFLTFQFGRRVLFASAPSSGPGMRVRHRGCFGALAAAIVPLCGAAHAADALPCAPSLVVRHATLAEPEGPERTWTAQVRVDPAGCAAQSGRFIVNFVRLKENAPDMTFSEPFTWSSGSIQISTQLAADEAVLDYSIAALPCTCRQGVPTPGARPLPTKGEPGEQNLSREAE